MKCKTKGSILKMFSKNNKIQKPIVRKWQKRIGGKKL